MPIVRGPPPPELLKRRKLELMNSVNVKTDSLAKSTSVTVPVEKIEVEQRRRFVVHKELYSSNPMHGLSFIHDAKSPIEIAFWYCLLAVFFIIMVNDLASLVSQYRAQPTVTKVNMKLNSTIHHPYMLVCFPLHPHDFRAVVFRSEYNSRYSGNISESGELAMPLDEQFIHVVELLTDKQSFLNAWEHPGFLETVFGYFYFYADAETQYGMQYTDLTEFEKSTEPPNEKAMGHLERAIHSFNVSHQELFEHLTEAVTAFVQLEVTAWVQSGVYSFSPASFGGHPLALIGVQKSCFKILSQIVKSAEETLEISIDYTKPNPFPYPRPVSILFGSQESEPKVTDVPKLTIDTNHRITAKIDVDAVFDALPNLGSCQFTSERSDCCRECRAQLIKSLCGCASFNGRYSNAARGLGICTLERYKTCLAYAGDDDHECVTECLPNCRKWSYRVETLAYEENNKYDSPSRATFALAFTNFVYPHFEEVRAIKWENFLGDTGGTLGLWLGGSFISLIHIVVFIIKLIVKNCRSCIFNRSKRHIQSLP